MKRTTTIAGSLLLAALVAACTAFERANDSQRAGSASSAGGFALAQAAPPMPSDRQIIRTADMRVEVDDVRKARAQAEAAVTARQGYLESAHETGDERVRLRFRVPASALDDFLAQLEELGNVDFASVSSTDVTEQHADLEVRLANNRKLRDRLRQLLDKAGTVEEILAVEKELARVQAEVESLQGRLERLSSQVALSQVSLTLERTTILGPLGYVTYGIYWVVKKLFVIR